MVVTVEPRRQGERQNCGPSYLRRGVVLQDPPTDGFFGPPNLSVGSPAAIGKCTYASPRKKSDLGRPASGRIVLRPYANDSEPNAFFQSESLWGGRWPRAGWHFRIWPYSRLERQPSKDVRLGERPCSDVYESNRSRSRPVGCPARWLLLLVRVGERSRGGGLSLEPAVGKRREDDRLARPPRAVLIVAKCGLPSSTG